MRGRLAGPSDAIALARLCAADMLLPVSLIKRQPDRTTFAALTEAASRPPFVSCFFRPFLSGVFLEDELETSAASSTWSGAACCAAPSACPGTASRRFPSS